MEFIPIAFFTASDQSERKVLGIDYLLLTNLSAIDAIIGKQTSTVQTVQKS